MAMEVNVLVTIPNVAPATVPLAESNGVWSANNYLLTRTCPVPGCGQVHLPAISFTYTPDWADWHNDTLTITYRTATVNAATIQPLTGLLAGLRRPNQLTGVTETVDPGGDTLTRDGAWLSSIINGQRAESQLFASSFVFVSTGMPVAFGATIDVMRHFEFERASSGDSVRVYEDAGGGTPGELVANCGLTGVILGVSGRVALFAFRPHRTLLALVRGVYYPFNSADGNIAIDTNAEDVTGIVLPLDAVPNGIKINNLPP